jgi:RNA recognition motif-containing protein
MHDPSQVTVTQIGPPYGLQTIPQESMGSTTLAVTNLPYRIRWQDLKDLFRRYGTPSRADVFLAPDGRSRGVGMVSMRTRREAENCVNDLNGYEWFGRKIGVKIDETGGHHALAAAAMAGATIWEGVGFSQPEYEVRFSHKVSCVIRRTTLKSAVPRDTPPLSFFRRLAVVHVRWLDERVPWLWRLPSTLNEPMTNVRELIGTFPAVAGVPWKREYDQSLSFTVGKSRTIRGKCNCPFSFRLVALTRVVT